MIMNDITIELNSNGAIVNGIQYDVNCFDYEGREALIIPAWDLISYDDGETWEDMD